MRETVNDKENKGSRFTHFDENLIPFLQEVFLDYCNCCSAQLPSLCCAYLLSCVWLFVTLWTITQQAPLSIGFSRQEYWNELPSLLQGIFPTQELTGLLHCRRILYCLSPQRSPTTFTTFLFYCEVKALWWRKTHAVANYMLGPVLSPLLIHPLDRHQKQMVLLVPILQTRKRGETLRPLPKSQSWRREELCCSNHPWLLPITRLYYLFYNIKGPSLFIGHSKRSPRYFCDSRTITDWKWRRVIISDMFDRKVWKIDVTLNDKSQANE